MNFYHSQNHSLGKVKETKAIEVSGLSDTYYTPRPWWGDGG